MAWTTLVGFHGSDSSWDALAFARRLTPTTSAALLLGAVYVYRPLGGRLESGERVHAEAHRARALGGLGVTESVALIAARSPAHGLCHLAETRGADLLVVGCPRVGRGRRLRRGGVADRVVLCSPCPLAVVPAGYRRGDHDLRVVAASFEGSIAAVRALGTAAGLARGCGARLRLYVDPPALEAVAGAIADMAGIDVDVVPRARSATKTLLPADDVDVVVLGDPPFTVVPPGRSIVALARRLQRPVVALPRRVAATDESPGVPLLQATP
jgi:nucleotide-binding universal stress UspA family protein